MLGSVTEHDRALSSAIRRTYSTGPNVFVKLAGRATTRRHAHSATVNRKVDVGFFRCTSKSPLLHTLSNIFRFQVEFWHTSLSLLEHFHAVIPALYALLPACRCLQTVNALAPCLMSLTPRSFSHDHTS